MESLQELCERGSEALVVTDYIGAERWLERAEAMALEEGDFDTLSRLYFPLQEARRQRRQRAGEGVISLPLEVADQGEEVLVADLAQRVGKGIVLIAGFESTEGSDKLRAYGRDQDLFIEVASGLAFRVAGGTAVYAVPKPVDLKGMRIPRSLEEIQRVLPPHAVLVLTDVGGVQTRRFDNSYAGAMALFEEMHRPYLAMADAMPVGLAKLEAYREVQRIDPASELAHQRAAFLCRELARGVR